MAPVQENFSEEERQLMLRLLIDRQLKQPDPALVRIISRLSGTDTAIVAHRAYASREVYALGPLASARGDGHEI